MAYARNRSLVELRRVSHRVTESYRPRTNGRIERFHQTMARESTGRGRCHIGARTTTSAGLTVLSEVSRRSLAFHNVLGQNNQTGLPPSSPDTWGADSALKAPDAGADRRGDAGPPTRLELGGVRCAAHRPSFTRK